MRRLLLLLALVTGWVFAQGPTIPARDSDELLARAKAVSRRAVEAARLGARVERTRDGRSFALQWWFGGGQQNADYYAPREMRRELEALMAAAGVRPENTLLHGSSPGADRAAQAP